MGQLVHPEQRKQVRRVVSTLLEILDHLSLIQRPAVVNYSRVSTLLEILDYGESVAGAVLRDKDTVSTLLEILDCLTRACTACSIDLRVSTLLEILVASTSAGSSRPS